MSDPVSRKARNKARREQFMREFLGTELKMLYEPEADNGRDDIDWELFEDTEPCADEDLRDEFGLPRGIPPPFGELVIWVSPQGSIEAEAFIEEITRWWTYLAPRLGWNDVVERLRDRPEIRLRMRAGHASSVMRAARAWRAPLDIELRFMTDGSPGLTAIYRPGDPVLRRK